MGCEAQLAAQLYKMAYKLYWNFHKTRYDKFHKVKKVKVSAILIGHVLKNEAYPVLGSQPAGDDMHSHEPGGGLPSPPSRPHNDTHALKTIQAR